MSKKIVTNNITDVRKACQSIGDKLATSFESNKDLKTVQTAIQAYGTALNAAKSQLIYKKLTGTPSRVEFFEN